MLDKLPHLVRASDVGDDQTPRAHVDHAQDAGAADVPDAHIGGQTAVFRRDDHVRGRFDGEAAVLRVDDDVIKARARQGLHRPAPAQLEKGAESRFAHVLHLMCGIW